MEGCGERKRRSRRRIKWMMRRQRRSRMMVGS
jgi:hypothetical protein